MLQKTVREKVLFQMCPMLRKLLVGLMCTLCLASQAAAAKLPISKQLNKVEPGTAIRVCTTDGRTLEGKLISASGATFELLEPGQEDSKTIECADVVTVSVIPEPAQRRGSRLVGALLVVGYFAATGIAIAVAGGVY